jgi:hypothetical protein
METEGLQKYSSFWLNVGNQLIGIDIFLDYVYYSNTVGVDWTVTCYCFENFHLKLGNES